jgi:hypothetical protein
MLGGVGAFFLPASAKAFTHGPANVGGSVRWARLKTASRTWNRHASSDPSLLDFIRTNTSLNIDSRWFAADVERLDEMIHYPFLFSEGIHHVVDQPGLDNLREYLQRDGFLFIDSCINTDINPDPDAFLAMQIATLTSLLPNAKIDRLPDDHEIYHVCFKLPDGLPHTYMRNIYDPAWAKHGLYSIRVDDHLIGLISLSGLQCGWDRMKPDEEHVTNCEKMMLNIYAYASTH